MAFIRFFQRVLAFMVSSLMGSLLSSSTSDVDDSSEKSDVDEQPSLLVDLLQQERVAPLQSDTLLGQTLPDASPLASPSNRTPHPSLLLPVSFFRAPQAFINPSESTSLTDDVAGIFDWSVTESPPVSAVNLPWQNSSSCAN